MSFYLLIIMLISPMAECQTQKSNLHAFGQWADMVIEKTYKSSTGNNEMYSRVEGTTEDGKDCGLFVTNKTIVAAGLTEYYLSLGTGLTVLKVINPEDEPDNRNELFVGRNISADEDVSLIDGIIRLKNASQDDVLNPPMTIQGFETDLVVHINQKGVPVRATTKLHDGKTLTCILTGST